LNVRTTGREIIPILNKRFMRTFTLSFLLIGLAASMQAQSPVISNKHFSIGSYGRAGIARGDNMLYPRSLNLNGMGSVGGRMEEPTILS
jgi:maltoporin